MSLKFCFWFLFQLFVFKLVNSEELQNVVTDKFSELVEIRRICDENTKQLEKVSFELDDVRQELKETYVAIEVMEKNVKLGAPK